MAMDEILRRHSCESRNPELFEFTRNGFPIKTFGNDIFGYFKSFSIDC